MNEYDKRTIERIREKTVYDGDCWRYTGKHVGNGYGSIWYKYGNMRLNRFIAMVYHDMGLTSTKVAAHKPECRFKDCWNPDHIYVISQKENVADQIKAGTFHYGTDNLFNNSRRGPRRRSGNADLK